MVLLKIIRLGGFGFFIVFFEWFFYFVVAHDVNEASCEMFYITLNSSN